MLILARVLADMGIAGAGADQNGYPGILGYEGPALSEVTGQPVLPLAPFIESLMVRKSEAEVALIRESARWCEHAHRLLQQYTRPGATEAEASLRAGHEATLAMLEALGDRVRRAAGILRRRVGRIPRPDRAQELLGARRRAQHRVPGRRRARHRDQRADLGLQRRARARDDRRHADRRDASTVRPHRRRSRGGIRRPAARRHVRRRRQRGAGLLRGQRPPAVLAAARRARDRAAKPRGAVPRRRRSHADRARHGVHDRARPLLGRDRRLPPLRHGRRHPGRDRHPHLVPQGHREPDACQSRPRAGPARRGSVRPGSRGSACPRPRAPE